MLKIKAIAINYDDDDDEMFEWCDSQSSHSDFTMLLPLHCTCVGGWGVCLELKYSIFILNFQFLLQFSGRVVKVVLGMCFKCPSFSISILFCPIYCITLKWVWRWCRGCAWNWNPQFYLHTYKIQFEALRQMAARQDFIFCKCQKLSNCILANVFKENKQKLASLGVALCLFCSLKEMRITFIHKDDH